MKRAKRLYILFGVLVAVCIATVCVLQYDQKQEEIQTSGETILTVDADTVSALDWETESDSLAFHKDGSWLYGEDEAFPVSEEKINDLLAEFEDFRAAFVIENVTDFAQYGLDEPVCTIDITTSDTNYEIQLGDYSSMDSQRYVSIGDGNVYLAVNDPLDAFDLTLSDMIAHDEVPSFDEVSSIHFDGPETYDVVWQEYSEDNVYTVCSDDVYYKQEGDDLLPLDTSAVEGYLSAISNTGYTEYVTYNVTDEELATYGLDDPEVTVTVEYTELDGDTETPGTFTLSVSRDPVELAAQATEEVLDESSSSAESTEETITAYARINDSKIIYKISGSSYEELMACIYRSLAEGYRKAVREMEEVVGTEVPCIHIVGGGSKDWYLNQLTAEFTGKTVYAGPAEATALGNILAQMLAVGIYASVEEARKAVGESFAVRKIEP